MIRPLELVGDPCTKSVPTQSKTPLPIIPFRIQLAWATIRLATPSLDNCNLTSVLLLK